MTVRLVWWLEKTDDGYVEAIPAAYLEAFPEDGEDAPPSE